MEYRRVGNSGLLVSELSLGTATFAGREVSSSEPGAIPTSNKHVG
jgi:aryl-alcohol dehydrogenase-like predicted oxidoreductase